MVTQAVKKLPALYGNQRFITMLTRIQYWSLTQTYMNPVHNFPSYFSKIHSNIILLSTPVL